jgi:capsular exopolysaccharide synthesis family protein
MELYKFIAPFRRWWWLLLATTLVASISSFLALSQQPPVYQSRTTLMIGRALEDPNPSGNEFALTLQLAEIYADMGNRESLKNATMEALGIEWLPEHQFRVLQGTQLIEITVVDTSPVRAQAVAAELANQLRKRSPASVQAGEQDRQEFINQQLNALEGQISDTQATIVSLQEELGRMVSAQQIADTQNQIVALQTKINTLNETYAALLANTEAGAINIIRVIEPADLPNLPMNTHKELIVLLASGIGLVLAVGVVYGIEYLDDTLKTEEDLNHILEMPVIGYIGELPEGEKAYTFMVDQPRSPIAESFRSLRTNLEFVSVGKPVKTVLVSSPGMSDGKSSVATNLAFSIAQAERKVILVDADLRCQTLHQKLGVSNQQGLSDVFRGRASLREVMVPVDQDGRFLFIPSGPVPPNPTELLMTARMDQILAELKELADIVILDSAPFFIADASVLSAKVDGVLLVVRPGTTHKGAVASMREQVRRASAVVLGVIVNQVPRSFGGFPGGFSGYGGQYAYPDNGDERERGRRFRLPKINLNRFQGQKRWSKPEEKKAS